MKANKASLILLFLVSISKIEANSRSQVLKESQVVLYTVKGTRQDHKQEEDAWGVYVVKGFTLDITGICFGTLISAKHVLTKSGCIEDNILNNELYGIKDALVARVIFSLLAYTYLLTAGRELMIRILYSG